MKKIFLLIILVNMANILLYNPVYATSSTPKPATSWISDGQPQPATIQDPILLKAWEYLYNQDEPFQMWDGSMMSGKKIAQTVLDRHIVIAWDPFHVDAYYAYSPRIPWDVAPIRMLNIPIYISPAFKDPSTENIEYLAGLISHELYHHSLPFGSVQDTLFEEYWAHIIQSNIAIKAWAEEPQHDSLNPFCLRKWFEDHDYYNYLNEFSLYPEAVASLVKESPEFCPIAPEIK
jgi:hypothetical protein